MCTHPAVPVHELCGFRGKSDGVEHDVGAAEGLDVVDPRVIRVVDGVVCSGAAGHFKFFFRRRHSDDRRAQGFGDLQCGGADASGATENQAHFAGLELGAQDKPRVRRGGGDEQRRRFFERHGVWHAEDGLAGHDNLFGVW